MAGITGKTVYVLGAGASQHTGAPLLRDFLVTARLLREGQANMKYGDSFDRIFNWIDRLRGASYYVEFDLDNLEHVFSLAEMSRQIGLEEGEQQFTDMTLLVMATLDACQKLRFSGDETHPDETYSSFVQTLVRLNDKRRQRIHAGAGKFDDDVVISFNYDVMLDHAMYYHRIGRDYRLEGTADERFRLLKLHGSTNWGQCSDCKKDTLQPVDPCPPNVPSHELIVSKLPPLLSFGSAIDFRMATEVLSNAQCWHCKRTNVLRPYVIPPTWSKAIGNTPLGPVWAAAVQAIQTASQIVVCGYSMPPTDTFFQYLLTLGLWSNPGLHRVGVINRHVDDGLRQRYERVFSRSLTDRGRLRFLESDFAGFVGGRMERVGNDVVWPEGWM